MSESTPTLPDADDPADATATADHEAEQPAPEPARRSRRRRVVKALAILASVVLVAVAVLAGVAAYYANKFDDNVDRIGDVFGEIPAATRPYHPVDKGQNFLLVGSDIRSEEPTTGAGTPEAGGGLTDVLMIIHVAGDKKSAHVISIPRDSWVDIPGYKGQHKINGAYQLGGPSLLVRTIEHVTRIRIDHYLAVDFAGFAAMTDAVGGVDIVVPIDSYDKYHQKRWSAGKQRMDGKTALLFVRQRYGLPRSDFDRIEHQHLFLRALMTKATDTGQLSNPVKLTRLLNAVTKSLSVDSGLDSGALRSLAFNLRGLRGGAVKFLTVPVRGFGRVGPLAVVFLDPARDEILYQAVRDDSLAKYRPPRAK